MVNPNEKIVIDPMPVFQKGLQLKVQKKKIGEKGTNNLVT
jgi:hypothetical protein